ncbi:MAG TPA: L,D-transpeptidase [Thermomicrobiales bacterium]|nr:L,D-transpeptidase [Thermomicrobiales bacterium]
MRMRMIVGLLAVALGLLALPGGAAASHDVGPDRAYFPATGHTVSYGFLDHWRHNGGLQIFGYPLTDEFTNPTTGLTTQYFERAVFEWHAANPPEWQVLLYRPGADAAAKPAAQPAFQPVVEGDSAHCDWFAVTGHRLCNGFRAYWQQHGGLPTFGYPLSEELSEDGLVVQYFERARFEWRPENRGTVYEVLLGRLGADRAAADKIDIAPAPRPDDVKEYDPRLWTIPAPPAPEPPVVTVPSGAPTWNAQWIEVDLSAQYMQAWEYATVVMGTWVSTGTADYPTPTGYFSVFSKLRYDDMTNGLAAPPGEYYYVEDVPWVMYFASGGYAIHGAYWHNMFGTPYSHGCVSTPLWAAEWFYNWAPWGITVWVHW